MRVSANKVSELGTEVKRGRRNACPQCYLRIVLVVIGGWAVNDPDGPIAFALSEDDMSDLRQ